MRRRLVWLLVILVILVVAADRVAWKLAENEVATRFQSDVGLNTKPDVSIGGFPFLTQVFDGLYKSVDADVDDLSVEEGVTLSEVRVRMTGLHVPFKSLVDRDLDTIPTDSGSVTGIVGYDSLDATANQSLSASGLEVHFVKGRAGGNQLAMVGTYTVGEIGTQISGNVAVYVEDGQLTISIPQDSLGVPVAVHDRIVKLLGVTFKVPPLPLGLKVTKIAAVQSGVSVTATGSDLMLGAALDLG